MTNAVLRNERGCVQNVFLILKITTRKVFARIGYFFSCRHLVAAYVSNIMILYVLGRIKKNCL